MPGPRFKFSAGLSGFVRIEGGHRARAWENAFPRVAPERVAQAFVRAFPLDQMRFDRRFPVRSRRLQTSLRLQQRGADVELLGEFYGYFLPIVSQLWEEYATRTLRRLQVNLNAIV